MNVSIINGPNINLIGSREPSIYGHTSIEAHNEKLKLKYPTIHFSFFQSNIEGEIINEIQRVGFLVDAIIINAGAYTHTSIAIADALRAVPVLKKIEVHISNVFNRETYRHTSFVAAACTGTITGFGLQSYDLAIQSLLE